jgi:hypothetical protein
MTLPQEAEADLQRAVLELAAAAGGWMAYHTHDSRHSAAGFPDLVLVDTRQHRLVWVELKSDRGRLSKPQAVWLQALERAGQEVHVWRPRHWKKIEDRILRRDVPRPTAFGQALPVP